MSRYRLRGFRIVILWMCCFVLSCAVPKLNLIEGSVQRVISPNGELEFRLEGVSGAFLYYSVFKSGHLLISNSQLGLEVDDRSIGAFAFLEERVDSTIEQSFLVRGNYREVNAEHNQAVFQFSSKSGDFDITVRASDKGIAFQYQLHTERKAMRLQREFTQFSLQPSARIWVADEYEGYWKLTKNAEIEKGKIIVFPLVAQLPSHYLLLSQAMHVDYGPVALKKTSSQHFSIDLIPPANRSKNMSDLGEMHYQAIKTPWRVIAVSDSLNDLVNNSLVYELADPQHEKFEDTSWLIPGRAGSSWISDGYEGQNTHTIRGQILANTKLGWEYLIIDNGWTHWLNQWDEVKALADLGREHGVKLIVWIPASDYQAEWQTRLFGEQPIVLGIIDRNQRRAFMQQAKNAGVAGLKVDFVGEDDLARVNFYREVLEDAADFKLLINFHGANAPTGLDRTYPNELGREAIRGVEKFRSSPKLFVLNTIYPFTRLVVGPGIYTPVLGWSTTNAGSRAHQLAAAIAFNSPMLVYGASPEKLVKRTEADLLKVLPSVWEETRVLTNSEIGELAVIAKRSGDEWYVAVLNADRHRDISVHFSEFIDETYIAEIYSDSKHSGEVEKNKMMVDGSDVFRQSFTPGGGVAMRLKPISKKR